MAITAADIVGIRGIGGGAGTCGLVNFSMTFW
jgi:hypothetical protein